MDYILVPVTKEIEESIQYCNEGNCNNNCKCFLEDDCLNNYHRLSEIIAKIQNAINDYMKRANVKIGEYYPNIDRAQTMLYAKDIIESILKETE